MRAIKHGLLWAGCAMLLLLALTQLLKLQQLDSQNQQLTTLLNGHDVDNDDLVGAAAEVRMAKVIYLRQKHRYEEALSLLNGLLQQAKPQLQAQSRYNLGNLYLVQAMEKAETGNINEAMPLLGLAKQAYREALLIDSRFWDAKYNLEVAMRLLPEMDRINSGGDDDNQSQPSQQWTTLPGFPRGLP